jgi:TetR/AcrR family transcriptional repressor of bet genes
MRSNLRSALGALAPAAEIESITLAITTLIDGLWLRAGLRADGWDRHAALRQMEDYIRHRLGEKVATLRSRSG